MEEDEKRFVDAAGNFNKIVVHQGANKPDVRHDLSYLDEVYMVDYFTRSISKRPPVSTRPSVPTMRPSFTFWYARKYGRKRVFDPFVLDGGRLVGAMLSKSDYVGSNTYYPAQKAYRDIIDAYGCNETALVLPFDYKEVFLRHKDKPFDMVVAHIPIWENPCRVLGFLWAKANEGMLIVLHFNSDNEAAIEVIEKLIKVLPGRSEMISPTPVPYMTTEQVITLQRTDFYDITESVPPLLRNKNSKTKRVTYKMVKSCVSLCIPIYTRSISSSSYNYIVRGNDSMVLDITTAVIQDGKKINVYADEDASVWLVNAISGEGASVNKYTPKAEMLSDMISTNDLVFAHCLYDIVDKCFPSSGPSRVWTTIDNTTYLNCLLIKWPNTTFLVCSRNYREDLSATLLYGPSRNGRVIVYRMTGPQKLQEYVDLYAHDDDAVLIHT
jgi:hypothetical protein